MSEHLHLDPNKLFINRINGYFEIETNNHDKFLTNKGTHPKIEMIEANQTLLKLMGLKNVDLSRVVQTDRRMTTTSEERKYLASAGMVLSWLTLASCPALCQVLIMLMVKDPTQK